MDWLHDATSISVIAKRLGVSWTMIAHIMDRGIKRGLERKPEKIVPHICVDETASKKGHNYVTIVSDRYGVTCVRGANNREFIRVLR